jgi:hypothetical protein
LAEPEPTALAAALATLMKSAPPAPPPLGLEFTSEFVQSRVLEFLQFVNDRPKTSLRERMTLWP